MTKMAQIPDEIVYKNVLAWRGCERLYLDVRTSDVFFIFEVDIEVYEKVPAHKSILSSTSPVFDAMFFGPHKQTGDVKIVDSTPGAFKEFLQFFYLSSVKLSSENVPEVMYLGKEYLLNDCLNASTDFCEATLTLDNMCWGYELALLFDLDRLRKFCERKISENTNEIFQSSTFLCCESNLLRKILRFNCFKCDESVVFDGCIAWAKANCIKNGIDETNMMNVRMRLGDLFDEIRFGRMKIEHFYARFLSHEHFFRENEFKEIISKIALKKFQPRSMKNGVRISENDSDDEDILICHRIGMNCDENQYHFQTNEIYDDLCIDKTIFRTNCSMILKRFSCQVNFCRDFKAGDYETQTKVRITENPCENYSGNLVSFVEILLNNSNEVNVELLELVEVKAGVKYAIEIELETGITYSSQKVAKQVRMEHGIVVDFFGEHYKGSEGIVKCLYFERLEESVKV